MVRIMSMLNSFDLAPNLKKPHNHTAPNNRSVSAVWVNAKLRKKIANLHLRDPENIEHHVSSLWNALPLLPNCCNNQVHVKGPFTGYSEPETYFVGPYPDSSDHLLSFTEDQEWVQWPTSRGLNHYDPHSKESRQQFDAQAAPHKFLPQQLVLFDEHSFLHKNQKLAPKWLGPHKILLLKGDCNIEIQLKHNNRKAVVHANRLKPNSVASKNLAVCPDFIDSQPLPQQFPGDVHPLYLKTTRLNDAPCCHTFKRSNILNLPLHLPHALLLLTHKNTLAQLHHLLPLCLLLAFLRDPWIMHPLPCACTLALALTPWHFPPLQKLNCLCPATSFARGGGIVRWWKWWCDYQLC